MSAVLLPDVFVGVGADVTVGSGTPSIVSVGAGDNETTVNYTVGVLRDVRRERLAVLEACNRLTRDNAAHPYFLHDADAGWDILVQVRLPLEVVVAARPYLPALAHHVPTVVSGVARDLRRTLGGEPFTTSTADLGRLLLRSLL